MSDYKYWIALKRVQGIGPSQMKNLYDILQSKNLSIIDIYDLSKEDIKREFSLNEKTISAIQSAKKGLPRVEEVYLKLIDSGFDVTLFFEDSYPGRLTELMDNNHPPILYSYGNKGIMKKKGAAILGDNEVSSKGDLIAYLAAKEMAKHGIPIISGMARGAELTAHNSALENRGQTVAVLPCGMLHLKIPDILKELYDPDRMLILSPFSPEKEFSVFNAYNRNRVICALSHAVFIVESPDEGGIFEAGKSAKNLGVPLFATEYNSYPKSANGNIKLIKELGAIPVRGRLEKDLLVPNIDKLIGTVKFTD